jgi:MFS family permease
MTTPPRDAPGILLKSTFSARRWVLWSAREVPLSDEKEKSPLGVILLTVFMDLVGFSMIFPLFPAMLVYYLDMEGRGGALGALLDTLESLTPAGGQEGSYYTVVLFGGVLGSLYSALQFIAAPIWGAISDRVGRRKVLVITVAGITLSYALWFVAGSFMLLVASRFLGGAMAGNLSVATAAVADVTDEKNRSKGMGMLGAAFGIGFILGPTLGGVLSLIHLENTLSFVPGVNPFSGAAAGAMLLSAINLVWIIRRFPETKRPAKGGEPARTFNLIKLFAPTPYPCVNRTNALYFVFIAAFAGMEFTLTFLARDRFQYTSLQNGLLFVYVGFIVAFIQGGVVRRVAPRFGEIKVTLFGLVLIVPGLVLVGLAQSQAMLYAGLGLLSAGSAFATPTLTALVSIYAPDDRQGEILGTFRSLGSLGRAVAPLLAAFAYWRYGSEWPYFGAAALLIIPILIAFTLPHRSDATS